MGACLSERFPSVAATDQGRTERRGAPAVPGGACAPEDRRATESSDADVDRRRGRDGTADEVEDGDLACVSTGPADLGGGSADDRGACFTPEGFVQVPSEVNLST
jgi:hypothetical protein